MLSAAKWDKETEPARKSAPFWKVWLLNHNGREVNGAEAHALNVQSSIYSHAQHAGLKASHKAVAHLTDRESDHGAPPLTRVPRMAAAVRRHLPS